jgi:Mg/Co/Ni transporter MgtE
VPLVHEPKVNAGSQTGALIVTERDMSTEDITHERRDRSGSFKAVYIGYQVIRTQ